MSRLKAAQEKKGICITPPDIYAIDLLGYQSSYNWCEEYQNQFSSMKLSAIK
jgi:hypothetical protein